MLFFEEMLFYKCQATFHVDIKKKMSWYLLLTMNITYFSIYTNGTMALTVHYYAEHILCKPVGQVA
jgi:hypothetical protein